MIFDESLMDAVSFGKVEMKHEERGYVFNRCTERQRQDIYVVDQRYFNGWGDGGFTNNSRLTAGVILDFYTDSPFITLETADESGVCELFVNGERVRTTEHEGRYTAQLAQGENRVTFYLAYCWATVIKAVETADGAVVRPVKKDKLLLCHGDSITHGMCCSLPSLMHTTRIGMKYGCEIINQGNSGYVHAPQIVDRVTDIHGAERTPDIITVAYGINDVVRKNYDDNRADMLSFYEKLTATFPHSRIVTVSPVWNDYLSKPEGREIKEAMYKLFDEISARFGTELICGLDLIPGDNKYFAEGLHPNDEGAAFYAENLGRRLFEK